MTESTDAGILFETQTPLGIRVRVTRAQWSVIESVKHPVMWGREASIKNTLEDPDEIRRSRSDKDVYLFYRLDKPGRWTCAVARRTDGEGFLITAYPTDAIKEGERLWQR